MKKYYITTPIYYPSGNLHLGHTYTTVAADVMKKHKEQLGYDVFFLTGTDEHGEKIEKKAIELGMDTKEYLDGMVTEIKELWSKLEIDYDKFLRTTDENHKVQVQEIFTRLLKNDDIYLGDYEGWYCVSCETFYTETQLHDGNCATCNGNVEWLKEKAYFFRCSKYADRLLDIIENEEEFVFPENRKKEIINSFFKKGIPDLAISRDSFSWGIKVPGDESSVIYVWLDALSNYITALNYTSDSDEFKEYWPADLQLLAKEIIRFHVIYWPMFLMALDLPLPKKIFAHGWLLMNGDKMSKSKGNIIRPEFLIDNYGVDSIKYYLLREIPFGNDGKFTPTSFVNRYNNELVNGLGNLVNRTIAMANKYFDGNITKKENYEFSEEIKLYREEVLEKHFVFMEDIAFSKDLENTWNLVSRTNKLIDQTTPWILYKEEKFEELESVLYAILSNIKIVSYLIYPYMKNTSINILKLLNENINLNYIDNNIELKDEYKVVKENDLLFNKLDPEIEVDKINQNLV